MVWTGVLCKGLRVWNVILGGLEGFGGFGGWDRKRVKSLYLLRSTWIVIPQILHIIVLLALCKSLAVLIGIRCVCFHVHPISLPKIVIVKSALRLLGILLFVR